MIKLLGIFDLVPGWIYAALIAALIASSCASNYRHSATVAGSLAKVEQANARASKAETELATYRGDAEAAARLASDAARTREQTLQKAADAARKTDHEEIIRIATQRDRALGELRKRPARPADNSAGAAAIAVPSTAGAGAHAAGCSGAQLYREDGEFLIGEAARADQVRAAYRSCRAAYERARSEGQVSEEGGRHADQ